jgi:branched-chain amino acid aminotransferase
MSDAPIEGRRAAQPQPAQPPSAGSVWIDGDLVPADQATVSVFDHGLTVGDAVFETMKLVRGRPFALGRHLARLRRSTAGLGLDLALDDAALTSAVAETVAACGLVEGRVRITVTGGVAPAGSDRGDAGPTTIVVASPATPWPPAATCVTVPWRRNEHGAVTGLKTTSYAENVVALAHARSLGADEAIFANTAGQLCEGTGTNVFVVLDGQLITPSLRSGCLAGVTRDLVVERLGVAEVDVPLERLAEVTDAFLTSSTRDVQPIGVLDGRPLSPCPGPETARALAAWQEIEAGPLDP